jgi:outer membrane protein
MNRPIFAIVTSLLCLSITGAGRAADSPAPRTLTLPECLELALKQNPNVLKAQQEIRRTQGVIVEARAAALPQVMTSGMYRQVDRGAIDSFPGSTGPRPNQEQPWSVTIEATQLVYSGGRVNAAVRAAKLADQISLLSFNRAVADTVLQVRTSLYRILLNQELVNVREQSIKLLDQQLQDTKHRFDVGAVPQFNVLRAEVELANAKPPLIRARNELRLSRERMAKLLAIDAPANQTFTPIQFTGTLAHEHRNWDLAQALNQALTQRPEIQQADRQVGLQKENLTVSKAGYQPELSIFGNYGVHNTLFGEELDHVNHGWTVGAQARWSLFDGFLTKGKVQQARRCTAQRGTRGPPGLLRLSPSTGAARSPEENRRAGRRKPAPGRGALPRRGRHPT